MHCDVVRYPEKLINALVRYKAELLTPCFIEEHGTIAVDSIFRVISVNQNDTPSVMAKIPGTPFTREIEVAHLEVMAQ